MNPLPPLEAPLLLSFGSNINPLENLKNGISSLHNLFGVAAISTIYRTKPLGNPSSPHYLNGALRLSTFPSSPLELKQCLKEVERQQGRIRQPDRNAPRTLDLDLAISGNLVLHHPSLSIPDPDIMQRWFLSFSLAQLAGDWIHPTAAISLSRLCQQFHPNLEEITPDMDATRILQAIPMQKKP